MYLTIASHNSEKEITGFKTEIVSFKDIPELVKKFSYCSNSLKDGRRTQNKDKSLQTGIEAYAGKEDVLILDIDAGVTIEQMSIFFGEYNYIIVTTKSHRKIKNGVMQGDRFRLFLELEYSIDNYEDRVFIIGEIYKTYFFLDQSVKSTNRFFYKSPEDAEVITNITGKTFSTHQYLNKKSILMCDDISKIITLNRVEATKTTKPISKVRLDEIFVYSELKECWINKYGEILVSENSSELNKDAKLKGALTILNNEFYAGNRNATLFKISCMLLKDGLDEDEIADFLIKENSSRDGIKLNELMQCLKSAFRTV